MGNAPFHKSREIQQAFEDVGHIYFHLPSLAPFVNHVAQWVFGHIKKHVQWIDFQNPPTLTCHIHDDVHSPPQSKVTPCCFSHIPHGTQIDVTHGIASLETTYGS
jgi:hypothetical protein